MGSELIRGMGGSVSSFAEGDCRGWWYWGIFLKGGGDFFSMCIFTCMGRSDCPMGLVGKLSNEAGYGFVKFSGEDLF